MRRLLLATMLVSAAAARADDASATRDVFLLLDEGPLHVRVHVAIGGKAPGAARAAYLEALFKSLDANHDGKLSKAEFARSPLNVSLRGGGRPMSADEAGKEVPRGELAKSLTRVAGDTLILRQDVAAAAEDLAVFKALDANGDGALDEAELANLPARLLALDADLDECVTMDELAPPESGDMPLGLRMATRGGPTASDLLHDAAGPLFPARLVRKYDRNADGKLSAKELGWPAERCAAADRNGDGTLGLEELGELRRLAPQWEIAFELQPAAGAAGFRTLSMNGRPAPPGEEFAFPGARLGVAHQTVDPVAAAVADAKRAFNMLDADQNGYIDRDEVKDRARFARGLFENLDGDGDGKIFWPELERYVRLRAEPAATRCEITLHDAGRGFFAALDRNRDGRIGLREIRVAGTSLAALRKPGNSGALKPDEPTRRLQLEVARGSFTLFGAGPMPMAADRRAVPARQPVGPVWFQRMDRNLDGDLTWNEFLGPRDAFDALDADRDGLIDPQEAERAEQLK